MRSRPAARPAPVPARSVRRASPASLGVALAALALGAAAGFGAVACADDPEGPAVGPDGDDAAAAEGGTTPGQGQEAGGSSSGGGGDDGAAPDDDGGTITSDGEVGQPLTVTSTAFAAGQALPAKYSCGPTNANPHVSPPLAWTGGQPGARSYAVVMRDQTLADAFHWLVWDIPASAGSLAENVARTASPAAPAGAKQAVVAFSSMYGDGAPGYFYACPPEADGAHTYTFTVYALPMAALPNVTPASTPDEVAAELSANALDIGTVAATLDR